MTPFIENSKRYKIFMGIGAAYEDDTISDERVSINVSPHFLNYLIKCGILQTMFEDIEDRLCVFHNGEIDNFYAHVYKNTEELQKFLKDMPNAFSAYEDYIMLKVIMSNNISDADIVSIAIIDRDIRAFSFEFVPKLTLLHSQLVSDDKSELRSHMMYFGFDYDDFGEYIHENYPQYEELVPHVFSTTKEEV